MQLDWGFVRSFARNRNNRPLNLGKPIVSDMHSHITSLGGIRGMDGIFFQSQLISELSIACCIQSDR